MLSLVELSKRYGDRQVLDSVSFEARPGRVVGFLGPNGAGKTTTMRCVFDLVHPDSGEVLWCGEPVGRDERLRFGYMPEERGMYPKMRIGEQLEYLARLVGMSRQQARESVLGWLERLGLADRERDRLEALSHGNQQRVQLAAALVHEPEVAVLDEPFAGLDPIGVAAMAAELRSLADRGSTIVFSSHQLDLVQDVCQDVVIVREGLVLLSGTLDELRESSPHRRLSVTVDHQPWAPEGHGLAATRAPAGDHLLVDRGVTVEQVLAQAGSAGTVTSLSLEPPTLGEVFHEVLAHGVGADGSAGGGLG